MLLEWGVNPGDLGYGSETYVKCLAENLGYEVIRGTKLYSRKANVVGVPDFYIFVNKDKGFFCEVKLEYCNLTNEQEQWIKDNPTENFRLVRLYRMNEVERRFSDELLLETKKGGYNKALFQKIKNHEGI